MRTTLDIDVSVLRDLKRLQKREGKSLGQLVSELLAQALAEKTRGAPARSLEWIRRDMGARVDLRDKEAVLAILDRS